MPACPKCSAPSPAGAAYCPRCGTLLGADAAGDDAGRVRDDTTDATQVLGAGSPVDERTRTSFVTPPHRGSDPVTPQPSSGLTASGAAARARSRHAASASVASGPVSQIGAASDPVGGGWFLPGAILAGRYRIVGRLGGGGMGEVYRADDLRLNQTVALKFLPPDFADDPKRLEVFHEEVRLARQVTHPNVVRVHDIGEVDGFFFLSMEYIDGEDLGSLLRRIGRVPPEDKALELTRQICAGLAAAHDRGMLHRDLKPANIMVDGRGRARITDFGLAAVSGSIRGVDVRSGTPVYMAPEQLEGREVTIRSDVYAVGLVLYELFTGKRPFETKNFQELLRRQHSDEFAAPSTLVTDIDPAVERVILRCLSPDPARRPASAIAVAASLPGGDPLAAALAAGETPSPELVAASEIEGAMKPWHAAACLAFIVGVLLLMTFTAPRAELVNMVRPGKPPEVLVERARELLTLAGATERGVDDARGLTPDSAYINWLQRHDTELVRHWPGLASRWYRGIYFWYREADMPLRPNNVGGTVRLDDPSLSGAGHRAVSLDDRGQLQLLVVNPARDDEVNPPAPSTPLDWTPLLKATGLDVAALVPVTPRWTPRSTIFDARTAWTGKAPDGSGHELRIEAASYRGRPTYLETFGPWETPGDLVRAPAKGVQYAQVINSMVVMGAFAFGVIVAWRNVKQGRGDRRGALRLGLALFMPLLAASLLLTHAPASLPEAWSRFAGNAGVVLFVSMLATALYLALEPVVRRCRPGALVAWSRLVAGRWRDPLVGRDVLVGMAFGAGWMLIDRLPYLLPPLFGAGTPAPGLGSLEPLLGTKGVIGSIAQLYINAIVTVVVMMFMISIGDRFNGPRIGYAIFFLVCGSLIFLQMQGMHVALALFSAVALSGIFTTVLARFGFVAGLATLVLAQWRFPYPADLGSWYAGSLAFLVGLLLALAVTGFLLATRRGIRAA